MYHGSPLSVNYEKRDAAFKTFQVNYFRGLLNMGFKLSSGGVLLFCTYTRLIAIYFKVEKMMNIFFRYQGIFMAFAILCFTAQKANAGINSCKQLEANFDTIQEKADEIRHVIGVMSKVGLSASDGGKSVLSEKIPAANKAITGFQIQIFPCFLFLNTNRYPMACQNAYQAMGVVVGLIRKNVLGPANEIANSSGNTRSMVEDFIDSDSSTTKKINRNMNGVNEYFRLCR